MIGFFEISNENNSGLIEKSDREGFVDNEAWRGFMFVASRARKWANDSLDAVRTAYHKYKDENAAGTKPKLFGRATGFIESELVKQRRTDATGSIQLAKQRGLALAKNIAAVRESVAVQSAAPNSAALKTVSADLSEISRSVADFQQILESAGVSAAEGFGAAERVIVSNELLTEHNLRLIDAAAVGLSARALSHELVNLLLRIEHGLANIRKVHRARPDRKLDDAIENIAGAIRELRKTVSSINPLLEGTRSLKDNFLVGDVVRDFIALRSIRLLEMKVTAAIVGGHGPEIRFARTRFYQVLENLFQNSLYWIDEHSPQVAGVTRTIDIEVDKYGFIWCDGAKGVREPIADSLFEPYVTDKPASRGQGLGLFLVTAFLETEKCHITLLPDRNNFGLRYKFRVDMRGAMVE